MLAERREVSVADFLYFFHGKLNSVSAQTIVIYHFARMYRMIHLKSWRLTVYVQGKEFELVVNSSLGG
jgi:hypothetical protein